MTDRDPFTRRANLRSHRNIGLLLATLLLGLAGLPLSAHAAGPFAEDFSNTGALPGPNLEQSALNTAATFDGSVATFPGIGNAGRSYLRTLDDDYNTTSFTAEITLMLNGNGGAGTGFRAWRGRPAG